MVTKGRGQRGKLLDVYVLAKPFKPYLDLWLKQREEFAKLQAIRLFPKYKNGEWLDEHIDSSLLNSFARTFSNLFGETFLFPFLETCVYYIFIGAEFT